MQVFYFLFLFFTFFKAKQWGQKGNKMEILWVSTQQVCDGIEYSEYKKINLL